MLLAGNLQQARLYALKNNLGHGWRYIRGVDDFKGRDAISIVKVGTWAENKVAVEAVEEYLQIEPGSL